MMPGFSSIKTAVENKLRCHMNYVGVVKINHSHYPKMFLKETMDSSHLVLIIFWRAVEQKLLIL